MEHPHGEMEHHEAPTPPPTLSIHAAPTTAGHVHALPSSWSVPTVAAPVHRHFDAALPDEWAPLFTRCFEDVRAILGGTFECHVVAVHTHRWPAGSSARAALASVAPLLGGGTQLQVGDYCTFQAAPRARILVLQYDTICPAHRRSVIAHEYLHVHQMSLLRELALGPAHDTLPMWLMEGTAALFEHLYINEFWSGLHRDGLEAALRFAHAEATAGRLAFGRRKETYEDVSMNYFVEVCAVCYLAHVCALWTRVEVLITTLWSRIYEAQGEWRGAFHSLFGRSPDTFYDDFNRFTASTTLEQMRRILPHAPVLGYCCPDKSRAEPLLRRLAYGGERTEPPGRVGVHLGRCGPERVGVTLTVGRSMVAN